MIYYVATERFSSTIRRFLKHNGVAVSGCLRSLTWEEIFFERGGPLGHYIFTDFDRLSRYELECAASFALALEKAEPAVRILNHPLGALERYPLLVKLHEAGINDFSATRVEADQRPTKYPVFIRAEDGYGGPDTDLIANDVEYEAALADLKRRGLPLRGRIAIGYAAERNADGYFRKYGAFNAGGEILPHHLMRGTDWVVKRHLQSADTRAAHQADFQPSEFGVDDEMDYVLQNPHRETLAKAFSVAGIDFGRADYGIVRGRPQIYEINTNPHLPGQARADARSARNRIVLDRLIAAFKAIDSTPTGRGFVSLKEPRPRAHNLHYPRLRLPLSLLRRIFRQRGTR